MKWNANVDVRLSIDYDDIEADTREEAEQVAIDRSDDYIVYCCWSDEED